MDLQKLKKFYEELKKEFEKEKISNSTFLETATHFLIHENISAEKKQSQQQQSSGNEATEKQIQYLQKQKIQIPVGLTKQEASKLISEIIERQKQSKSQEQEGNYDY